MKQSIHVGELIQKKFEELHPDNNDFGIEYISDLVRDYDNQQYKVR